MNKFSHVALFSVALLVSGSMFAQEGRWTSFKNGVSSRWDKFCATPAMQTAGTWATTAKDGVTKTAKTVWTPDFVMNPAVAAQAAVEAKPAVPAVVVDGVETVPAQAAVEAKPEVEAKDATLNCYKAYSFRTALISPVVLATGYAVYKYRNAIASKFNAVRSYVAAKLFSKQVGLRQRAARA